MVAEHPQGVRSDRVVTINSAASPRPVTSRRLRLALFPGAFRPPHEAHLTAIVELAARPDVDEVVVIVSGRARHLPGTRCVLPPQVVRPVLELYLKDAPKVRIDVAERTAIARANEYIASAEPGDTIILCLGEADRGAGDDRFRPSADSHARGVNVQVVAAATGHLVVRATDLRQALAQGLAGRGPFMSLLPRALTSEEREHVWNTCHEGLIPIDEWVAQKVRAHVTGHALGTIVSLTPVRSDSLDPSFRIVLSDGRRLIGKYSGDALDDAAFGEPGRLKPRRRLRVEARVLERLLELNAGPVVVPRVVCFDRGASALVLSEILPDARPLELQLACEPCGLDVSRKLGRWLGALHAHDRATAPLWGSSTADRTHWTETLARSTRAAASGDLPQVLRTRVLAAIQESVGASRDGLHHLQFEPRHVLVDDDRVGVIDFERAGGHGDPAFDLATMIAGLEYFPLLGASTGERAPDGAGSLVGGYCETATPEPAVAARASALAAAVLLTRTEHDAALRSRGRRAAERLLNAHE